MSTIEWEDTEILIRDPDGDLTFAQRHPCFMKPAAMRTLLQISRLLNEVRRIKRRGELLRVAEERRFS